GRTADFRNHQRRGRRTGGLYDRPLCGRRLLSRPYRPREGREPQRAGHAFRTAGVRRLLHAARSLRCGGRSSQPLLRLRRHCATGTPRRGDRTGRNGARRMKLCFILDPLPLIKSAKDSTYAMMVEAERRGHAVEVMMQEALMWKGGRVLGRTTPITLTGDEADWYRLDQPRETALTGFDAVLMRKDPPF